MHTYRQFADSRKVLCFTRVLILPSSDYGRPQDFSMGGQINGYGDSRSPTGPAERSPDGGVAAKLPEADMF